ncbi:hypothetical protein PRK99_20680 [Pectobacterium polonicum]|uniref:hypothetical protein n=1 Tax=Pectobacterium polonicum TaxID=2485124 RepID=UPI0023603047|nr:hypothetical protein [Pectobacterium polonicum]MDC9821766.1 hypothetical protein [Pectobacterium polonicum]
MRRAHAHAVFHYQHSDRGQLVSLKREPTEEGLAQGLTADEVRLTYDAAGYLSGECGSEGSITYTRDALGNVSTLSLPEGDTLRWLHYGSGHVSAVKFNHQVISEFTRDRLHREITRTQGRREQRREYDRLGRLASQRSGLWEVAGPALAHEMIQRGDLLRLSNDVIRPFYQQRMTETIAIIRRYLSPEQCLIHKPEATVLNTIFNR